MEKLHDTSAKLHLQSNFWLVDLIDFWFFQKVHLKITFFRTHGTYLHDTDEASMDKIITLGKEKKQKKKLAFGSIILKTWSASL